MKNRRKHKRFTIKAITDVLCLEEDRWMSAYVGGISRGGLELYSKESVKEGTKLQLRLHFLDKDGRAQLEEVEGEVRWTAPFQDNHISGIEFKADLSARKNPGLIQYLEKAEKYIGG